MPEGKRAKWRRSAATAGLSAGLAAAALSGCDRPEREPPRGAAAPLPFETAARASSAPAAEERGSRGASCPSGAHRCEAEKLVACDPAQGGWVQVNVCQSAAHCNAKLGQCLVDPCVLGEHQCAGAKLEQCQANGWTVVRDCGSPADCDAESGNCR